MMNASNFWEIIDSAREEGDGWENMYEPLVNRLAVLEPNDILNWANILNEYISLSYKEKVWAAAYIINSGCSDDSFEYFRCWLIAQGKTVFLNTLKDPDSLADVESAEEDADFEDILIAAINAYFIRMEIEDDDYDIFYDKMDEIDLSDEIKNEIISEIEYAKDIDFEWSEDEDDLKKLLPNLYKKFMQ